MGWVDGGNSITQFDIKIRLLWGERKGKLLNSSRWLKPLTFLPPLVTKEAVVFVYKLSCIAWHSDSANKNWGPSLCALSGAASCCLQRN